MTSPKQMIHLNGGITEHTYKFTGRFWFLFRTSWKPDNKQNPVLGIETQQKRKLSLLIDGTNQE